MEIRREASADALPLQGIVHFEVRRFPETTALQRKLFIPPSRLAAVTED